MANPFDETSKSNNPFTRSGSQRGSVILRDRRSTRRDRKLPDGAPSPVVEKRFEDSDYAPNKDEVPPTSERGDPVGSFSRSSSQRSSVVLLDRRGSRRNTNQDAKSDLSQPNQKVIEDDTETMKSSSPFVRMGSQRSSLSIVDRRSTRRNPVKSSEVTEKEDYKPFEITLKSTIEKPEVTISSSTRGNSGISLESIDEKAPLESNTKESPFVRMGSQRSSLNIIDRRSIRRVQNKPSETEHTVPENAVKQISARRQVTDSQSDKPISESSSKSGIDSKTNSYDQVPNPSPFVRSGSQRSSLSIVDRRSTRRGKPSSDNQNSTTPGGDKMSVNSFEPKVIVPSSNVEAKTLASVTAPEVDQSCQNSSTNPSTDSPFIRTDSIRISTRRGQFSVKNHTSDSDRVSDDSSKQPNSNEMAMVMTPSNLAAPPNPIMSTSPDSRSGRISKDEALTLFARTQSSLSSSLEAIEESSEDAIESFNRRPAENLGHISTDTEEDDWISSAPLPLSVDSQLSKPSNQSLRSSTTPVPEQPQESPREMPKILSPLNRMGSQRSDIVLMDRRSTRRTRDRPNIGAAGMVNGLAEDRIPNRVTSPVSVQSKLSTSKTPEPDRRTSQDSEMDTHSQMSVSEYNGMSARHRSSDRSAASGRSKSGLESMADENLKLENEGLRSMLSDANRIINSMKSHTVNLESELAEKTIDVDRLSRELCRLKNRLLQDGLTKYLEIK